MIAPAEWKFAIRACILKALENPNKQCKAIQKNASFHLLLMKHHVLQLKHKNVFRKFHRGQHEAKNTGE